MAHAVSDRHTKHETGLPRRQALSFKLNVRAQRKRTDLHPPPLASRVLAERAMTEGCEKNPFDSIAPLGDDTYA